MSEGWYMKPDKSLKSNSILDNTCAFSMTCSCTGKVPGRCSDDAKKKEASAKVCGSAETCGKTLYLTGKTDKGNTYDPNARMVVKKHPNYNVI